MRSSIALMAVLAAATATHAAASGVPLISFPDTQFNIQLGSHFLSTPGTLDDAAATATGGVTPGGPFVGVSGVGEGPSASATWEFEITGPAGVNVPIIITSSYDAAVTGAGVASGGLNYGLYNFSATDSYLYTFLCESSQAAQCGTHDFNLHETAATGDEYQLLIATGGGTGGGAGSFSSHVDPMVTIDPTFVAPPGFNLSDFHLVGSPDVFVPSGGAPEPAAWALMLLGFGSVGAVLRRRRPPIPAAG